MHRIAFVLAGLAYSGHGWRDPLSRKRLEGTLGAQSKRSDAQVGVSRRVGAVELLAALLVELNPAAAFNPWSPGLKSKVGSFRPVVSETQGRLGHQAPVMKRPKKLKMKYFGNGINLPETIIRAPRGEKLLARQGESAKLRDIQGLHVTAGAFRNRRLITPDVHLRPMMSRVREALFNILLPTGVFREGQAALDLFAGSGAVGLESLSRGIGSATFVDFSPKCTETIHKNAERCGVKDSINVVEARVDDFLQDPDRFGVSSGTHAHPTFALVTVTPPYEEVVYSELVMQVAKSPAIGRDTIVVIEYPIELGCFPPTFANTSLVGVRNRRYGRTVVAVYINSPSSYMLEVLPPLHSEFVSV